MNRKKIIIYITALLVVASISNAITVSSNMLTNTASVGAVSNTQSVNLTGSQWYLSGMANFTVVNTTSTPIDLSKITFSLPASYGGTTDIWSAYIN
ncbi:MAG: hypothetical protein NTX05_01745, partial [Fusobacteria bacterium]|nr:hypothetical protein [Fusobacteriota bacterium]